MRPGHQRQVQLTVLAKLAVLLPQLDKKNHILTEAKLLQ
jgi:hypothetical protein